MEHYPILQKQLLFGSSSCFGSLEQNVFVLLNDKSRMKGDFQVRFREKFEVKFLLLTRLRGRGFNKSPPTRLFMKSLLNGYTFNH